MHACATTCVRVALARGHPWVPFPAYPAHTYPHVEAKLVDTQQLRLAHIIDWDASEDGGEAAKRRLVQPVDLTQQRGDNGREGIGLRRRVLHDW